MRKLSKSVYTIDLAGATATVAGGETVTVGGVTLVTSTVAAETASQLATLAAAVPTITINGIVYNKSVSGTVVTLTSVNPVIAPAASLAISGTIVTKPTKTTTELSFSAADLDVGTLTVAKVETINISTSDLTTDVASAVDTITLNLAADAAKTVAITGNADLDLTITSTTVTKVDAHALTGALTYTANDNATIVGTEVIGGAGNDILIASGNSDILIGGAGNDTLTAANFAQLTGGTGADMFVANIVTANNSFATIKDFNKAEGDSIKFTGAAAFNNTKVDALATFDGTLAAAATAATVAGGVSWFTFKDNATQSTDTYLVYNAGVDSIFAAGTDTVIKVAGVVDFSTASLNVDGIIAFA